MHDAGKITAGLVVFLALVTSPVWYQAARGAETGPPDLGSASKGEGCVESGKYMRSLHGLLNAWRDRRSGRRQIYVGACGEEYEKSLAGTCLDCHTSKEAFCDRCRIRGSGAILLGVPWQPPSALSGSISAGPIAAG
jgi:hypothetical protein